MPDVGARTNVGAGTITCNYDGLRQAPHHDRAGVFVGSDAVLVAPLTSATARSSPPAA